MGALQKVIPLAAKLKARLLNRKTASRLAFGIGPYVSHGGTGPPDALWALSHFGTRAAARAAIKGNPSAAITSGELNAKKFLTLLDRMVHHTPSELAKDIEDKLKIENLARVIAKTEKVQGSETAGQELADVLKRRGFDALRYVNRGEDPGSTSYISLYDGQFTPFGER